MATKMVFAYGSNLNLADFNSWCEKHGKPENLLKFKMTGLLPDHELAFSYRSESRNGGVLDVRPCKGQVVQGVLFEVGEEGLQALDQKEGVGIHCYERIPVQVIDSRGNIIDAITYRVCKNKTRDYVKPSREYLKIVRAGLREWDLSTDPVNAAAENRSSKKPNGFFFYGTLLRGESRFPMIKKFGIQCVILANTFGRLLDLGEYPGLVDIDVSELEVLGEFVRLENPDEAIPELDEIEGFRGYGKSGSLYRRTIIEVHVGDGRTRQAWTYCLESERISGTPIESGDWREHLGKREDFLNRLAEIHSGRDEMRLAERIAQDIRFSRHEDREQDIRSLLPISRILANGELSERKLAMASGLWTAVP